MAFHYSHSNVHFGHDLFCAHVHFQGAHVKITVTESHPGELAEALDQPGELEKALKRIKAVKEHDRRRRDRFKYVALRDLEDIGRAEYERLMKELIGKIEKVMAAPVKKAG